VPIEYDRLFAAGLDLQDIPAAAMGEWEITHTTTRDRTQTTLAHDTRGEVMSNADIEIDAAASFAASSSGHIVVLGLGLGLVTRLLLARREVDFVDVIESEFHVIELTGKQLLLQHYGRVQLHNADAYSPEVIEVFGRQRRPDAVFADTFDTADEHTWADRQEARRLWGPHTERLVIWEEARSQMAARSRLGSM